MILENFFKKKHSIFQKREKSFFRFFVSLEKKFLIFLKTVLIIMFKIKF